MPSNRNEAPASGTASISDVFLPARWGRAEFAVILLFLGVVAWIYRFVLGELVQQWWTDADYSHGFLVPIFSGVLVWQRRDRLRALVPEGSWVGLAVLLAGLGAFVVGELAFSTFVARLSLIVVLAGLVLFHLGWKMFKVLAFPLLFLLFAIPLPDIYLALTLPLQNLAARNAAWLLDLFGVPVLLDGNVIHLSQISLGVTEACSGIRSLVSLVCVAVALGSLTLATGWGMAALVASAVPITVGANAIRVVSTGLAGQWFGVEYARGFFHSFSGMAAFVLALLCLMAFQRAIRFAEGRWRARR